MVERGEQAYSKWGRVAVFFTPALVAGTAKMQHGQFVVWNLLASFAFSLSVAASAYGIGQLVRGQHSARDILILLVGLSVGAVIALLYVRRRRRRLTRARSTDSAQG
jgi:membrane protein DedA with SNARE-associated domain